MSSWCDGPADREGIARLHRASLTTAYQIDNFIRSRKRPCMLLGIDFLLIDENV